MVVCFDDLPLVGLCLIIILVVDVCLRGCLYFSLGFLLVCLPIVILCVVLVWLIGLVGVVCC